MDPHDRGVADGRPSGGGSGWAPTTVPDVFDGRPLAAEFGGTVGWYRVTFTGPPAGEGRAWALRFGSARRVADAWLNGRPIGRHTDPYVPFELPADGLRPGAPNALVVRVDNRKAKEPREGWWNWGGMVRPVTLVPRGRLVLADAALLYAGGGGVLFDGWLTNRSPTRLPARIDVLLRAPSGRLTRAMRDAGSLGPGERRRVRFELRVAHPELWSPGNPQRYEATIATRSGPRVEQRDRRLVGLRTVAVRGGLLYVDSRRVDLRGASIQEDVPGRGPALTDTDIKRVVAELTAVGANVTRAHYLLDDRLLDALDAAGIMVWSQSPIYHRDRLLETPAQRATALATVRGTVLAARVHPSVIAHSVANELSVVPDSVPGTRAFLDGARTLTHDLDPTVPVAVDMLSYPGYRRQRTYGRFPLLGINSYFGWYPGKKAHRTSNLDDLATYLRRTRWMYPEAALVMTEFGAESTFAGPTGVKETYAFQTRFVRHTLDILRSLPFMSGGIYWTLREFAVKPHWDGGAQRSDVPRDSIHNKGLITYGGRRKPAWSAARDAFAATPLYPPAVPAAGPKPSPAGWALIVAVPLAILALLALAAWALRDVWRLERPPEAEIIELPARRAA
jgi:beta-glucuronidase